MNWFRRHIHAGSHLALVALALQFVLALGHVHLPERIGHAGDVAATISQVAASVTSGDDHGPDHGHHHAAGDYCVLCAVATQAQAMLASAAPLLTPPAQVRAAIIAANYDSQAPPRRTGFRSRAPPLA